MGCIGGETGSELGVLCVCSIHWLNSFEMQKDSGKRALWHLTRRAGRAVALKDDPRPANDIIHHMDKVTEGWAICTYCFCSSDSVIFPPAREIPSQKAFLQEF